MPHYQISVRNGEPIIRKFVPNLRVFSKDEKFYCAPSKGELTEQTISELETDDALYLYFFWNGLFAETRELCTGYSLQDVKLFEDRKLGIVYVNDSRYIQPVVEALKKGSSLLSISPPE